MKDTVAREPTHLGEYIKARRKEQDMSVRQLASKARIDKGGLTRIEQGTRGNSPGPDVINRLARALDVPVTDLLTRVGYEVPNDLHSFIRSHYGHLPEEVIASIVAYVERIAIKYDIDPRGPIDGEDEGQPQLTDS